VSILHCVDIATDMKISTGGTLFSILLAGGRKLCFVTPFSAPPYISKRNASLPPSKRCDDLQLCFKRPSLRFWRKTADQTDEPPDVSTDDDYKFTRENEQAGKITPKVGDLIGEMIKGSEFVYTYGSVRRILLKHDKTLKKIRGNKEWLGLPNESEYLVEFDSPDLVKELFGNERFDDIRYFKKPIKAEAYLEFLRRNRKYFKQAPDGGPVKFNFNYKFSSGLQLPYEEYMAKATEVDGRLLELDDELTLEGGLVYAMLSNRLSRRGTVVFRGTVGGVDLPTCANFFPNDQVFKSKDYGGLDIKVHSGFASYLFDKNEDGLSKYDRLVACIKFYYGTLPPDIQADYRLYVTGHSLGGALSNMFAFAAAQEDHPFFKKISVVTFAAPVVGNEGYNRAFQNYEKSGKLSLLRISNEGDVICSKHLPGYTQNGVNMHLLPDGKKMELRYRNTKGIFTQVTPDPLKCHSFPEYMKRLYSPVHEEMFEQTLEEVILTGDDFTK